MWEKYDAQTPIILIIDSSVTISESQTDSDLFTSHKCLLAGRE